MVAASAARVERWFAESNYHHSEFADLAGSSRSSTARRDLSAVLPTLNEAATIGPIVATRGAS